MIQLNFWPTLAFAVMVLSWIAFVIAFLTHKKPPSPPDSKRDPSSIVGIVFQGLSYAIVWSVRREWFTPIIPVVKIGDIALTFGIAILAIGSVWFTALAIRTLGKEWSLAARLVEGHRLVTEGPYRIVRNPIYTGMFGMLLATGLAVSHWVGLLAAIAIYAIGTVIRVRSEEKLLREAFGAEFDNYAREVSAVVPFIF